MSKLKIWLIIAMIIIPILGFLFDVYALFLFLPLGVLSIKNEGKSDE